MSFSREVKEEISNQNCKARHCMIAEISALFSVYGKIMTDKNSKVILKFVSENLTVAKKYFILVKKAFDFSLELSVKSAKHAKKSQIMQLMLVRPNEVKVLLKALKLLDEDEQWVIKNSLVNTRLISRDCCRRAFLRGMFLASGSITDPTHGYHLEIVTTNETYATGLIHILSSVAVNAKMVKRKKNYIVYMKEGEQIVNLLNLMEAHVALMKFENVRILKEMRNSINRQVNCETANIKKVVSAATKQIEDITYIRDNMGFGMLSEGLAEVAKLRIEHLEASLKELGEMLDPPIGKSGVNHRLRMISKVATELRRHKEEEK